jgi:hypothetical protein
MASVNHEEIIDLSGYMSMSTEEIEELTSNSLAPKEGTKLYYFKIKDFEVKEWDDGKRNLNLTTEVTRGEKKGWNGPFMNLGLNPYIDRDAEQPDEDTYKKLKDVQALRYLERIRKITNNKLVSLPAASELVLLKASGEIVKDCEFVAAVKRGPKGYAQFANYYSLDGAPDVMNDEPVAAFSI